MALLTTGHHFTFSRIPSKEEANETGNYFEILKLSATGEG